MLYSQRTISAGTAVTRQSAVLRYAQRARPSDRSVTITLSVTCVLLTLRPQLKFLVHRNSIGCCPDSFLLCARKSGPETTVILPSRPVGGVWLRDYLLCFAKKWQHVRGPQLFHPSVLPRHEFSSSTALQSTRIRGREGGGA